MLTTLLDGLLWRARKTFQGTRRVNYFVKRLGQPKMLWELERLVLKEPRSQFRQSLESNFCADCQMKTHCVVQREWRSCRQHRESSPPVTVVYFAMHQLIPHFQILPSWKTTCPPRMHPIEAFASRWWWRLQSGLGSLTLTPPETSQEDQVFERFHLYSFLLVLIIILLLSLLI